MEHPARDPGQVLSDKLSAMIARQRPTVKVEQHTECGPEGSVQQYAIDILVHEEDCVTVNFPDDKIVVFSHANCNDMREIHIGDPEFPEELQDALALCGVRLDLSGLVDPSDD